MNRKNVCDFSDLLFHAESLGYGWNEAHGMLDNIYPMHGPQDVYHSEVSEYGLCKDGEKILNSFFDKEGVGEFQINPKSC